MFVLLRGNGVIPIKPETVFEPGDKVLAIARTGSEAQLERELIGDGEPAGAAVGR
jgi:Trk K+ transport system NAD-binding subunit